MITRFIDPQKAEFLVDYLEALAKTGNISPQRTTLLFNCYTKLSKGTELESEQWSRSSTPSGYQKLVAQCDRCVELGLAGREAEFDLQTAVQVLILADYKDQALRIANAHHLHTEYTQMLAQTGDYVKILEYIRDVETAIATKILQTYGNDMMAAFDEMQRQEFNDYMFSACTRGLRARPGAAERLALNLDRIMRVFLNFPAEQYDLLSRYVSYMKEAEQIDRISQDIWNTIIELSCTLGYEDEAREYFALAAGRFDSEQLLMLFSAERCHYGMLLVYEHLGYFQEILKISKGAEIREVCLRHGKADPDLWRLGLVKLCKAKDEENLCALIQAIADEDAVPLLAVIQILKVSNFATLQMIKPLAAKVFHERQQEIEILRQQYEEIETRVVAQEELCDDLMYKHFIAKATKCSACNSGIDLPAKHFFCGHSFHMRCLGDDLTKCPTCKEKQEQTVKKKVQSYTRARQLLKLDITGKHRFKLLEHMNAEEFGEGEADTFMRLTDALTCDLLNPDDGKAKCHEAKKLLAEYAQH